LPWFEPINILENSKCPTQSNLYNDTKVQEPQTKFVWYHAVSSKKK